MNWDDPDADWTNEYGWTRYRGPQPWPCPADWVLNIPEEGGAVWYRYPGLGEGMETDNDVLDLFDANEDEEREDARGETAILIADPLEVDLRRGTETIEYRLEIDGETVFRRVDSDYDDVLASVAEAMSRYSNGQSLDDVAPSSGRLPDDIQSQQELEQRKSENRSLGDFETRSPESTRDGGRE